jgi:hypothetical protein
MQRTTSCTVAVFLAAGLWACGGGGASTPTSPSPTPGGTGSTPAPTTATMTIGAGGISPRAVTIARGGRVTVVNNNNRVHEIASDAHPNHTDCPEINLLGTLSPGQTGVTGALNTARVCGFYDHLNPDDSGLRGTITIQ